jgi:hypothetical protein
LVATMVSTSSAVQVPDYEQKPFFSSIFRCSIAIGSKFIFTRPSNRKKLIVGQIIGARKASEDDHEVTVSIFRAFDEWPPNTTLYPIKEGLGKNLVEVVITSESSDFLFDCDV